MTNAVKRYRAFISYSQKDKGAAIRLHKALEAYRVPAGLELGDIDPKMRRLGRVFRDDDEMGAAASLGAALQGAIADSQNLIVICSPNAAASRWVNEEILHFRRTGRAGNIFAVIVDGEPNAAETTRECFPPALRFPEEPLALNARKEPYARLLTRLCAGLLGTPFDALWKREQRRRQTRAIQLGAIALSAILIVGTLSGLAWFNAERTSARAILEASRNASLSDEQRLRIAMLAYRLSLDNTVRREANQRLIDVFSGSGGYWVIRRQDTLAGAALSPDGTHLITLSAEGAAELLEFETGNRVAALECPEGMPWTPIFSNDGRHAAAICNDNTLRIWEATTGRATLQIPGPANTRWQGIGFNPTGSRVLGAFEDNSQIVWDVDNGGQIGVLRADAEASGAAFSPDGVRLATFHENDVRLWDLNAGRALAVLHGHTGTISASAFSPDGRTIVTASWDGSARLWDVQSGRLLNLLASETGNVSDASFSPDGRFILTASGSSAFLWDARSGRLVRELRGHARGVLTAEFSPDGALIVTSAEDQSARIWETSSGAELKRLDHPARVAHASFTDHGAHIMTIALDATMRLWSTDGTEIAVRRGANGFMDISQSGDRILSMSDAGVEAWRYVGRRELLTLAQPGRVNAAVTSPRGDRVVTIQRGGVGRLWNASSGEQIALLHHDVYAAAFNPDGTQFFTLTRFGRLTKWDAAAGQNVADQTTETLVDEAAFSADGSRVVVTAGSSVLVMNPITGTEIARFGTDEHNIEQAWISPDGARVVTATPDGATLVWDAASGREIGQLAGTHRSILGGSFNADGSRLVTVSDDATASVWDTNALNLLARLRSDGEISSVAISPDGALATIAQMNGSISVFEVATQREIARLGDHIGQIEGVAFSPDGARISSSSRDERTILWDATILSRTQTQNEPREYMVRLACDPSQGRLSGGRGVISAADAERAPVLRNYLGRDVCAARMSHWPNWMTLSRSPQD